MNVINDNNDYTIKLQVHKLLGYWKTSRSYQEDLCLSLVEKLKKKQIDWDCRHLISSLGEFIWNCWQPMQLMHARHENGKFIATLNEDTLNKLRAVDKKVQVVWSIGRWKEQNVSFFNDLRYKWFQESGMDDRKTGIWIWISDHFKKKDMSLLLVESTITGQRALDFELGFMAFLMSSTLLWNMDEEKCQGLEDMKEVFFHLPHVKEDFQNIQSSYSAVVKLTGPVFIGIAHNSETKYLSSIRGKALGANDHILENHLNDESADTNLKHAFKSIFPKRHYFRMPKEGENNIGRPTCEKHFQELEDFILEELRRPKNFWGKNVTVKLFVDIIQTYIERCNQGILNVIDWQK